MSEASEAGTVHAHEAAHFGRMAADWWDPRGSSAPLHQLNPPRLAYLRERIDAVGDDVASLRAETKDGLEDLTIRVNGITVIMSVIAGNFHDHEERVSTLEGRSA